MKDQAVLTGSDKEESSNFQQKAAPVATLVVLAPVFAELLMGVVHLTNLWLLIPEMAVYGSAAVIIRDLVRRRGSHWSAMLLLSVAYAIAEECVILQTSLTPQFFPPGSFGWVGGVQWIYLVALVWYESVYAMVLPIYFTEMLFPRQHAVPWLSKRGFAIACAVFLLSSIGVYELWHRVGLQRYGNSNYQVPLLYVAVALLASAALIALGLFAGKPTKPMERSRRNAPAAWLVGFMAFGFGLLWFVLIVLAYVPASAVRNASPVMPIAIGLLWLLAGIGTLRRISAAAGWDDSHRLALIFGMSLASMIGGTATVLRSAPVDIIGKFAFDLVAVLLFAWFALRLRSARRAG